MLRRRVGWAEVYRAEVVGTIKAHYLFPCVDSLVFRYDDIMDGAILELVMGPSRSPWALGGVHAQQFLCFHVDRSHLGFAEFECGCSSLACCSV